MVGAREGRDRGALQAAGPVSLAARRLVFPMMMECE